MIARKIKLKKIKIWKKNGEKKYKKLRLEANSEQTLLVAVLCPSFFSYCCESGDALVPRPCSAWSTSSWDVGPLISNKDRDRVLLRLVERCLPCNKWVHGQRWLTSFLSINQINQSLFLFFCFCIHFYFSCLPSVIIIDNGTISLVIKTLGKTNQSHRTAV